MHACTQICTYLAPHVRNRDQTFKHGNNNTSKQTNYIQNDRQESRSKTKRWGRTRRGSKQEQLGKVRRSQPGSETGKKTRKERGKETRRETGKETRRETRKERKPNHQPSLDDATMADDNTDNFEKPAKYCDGGFCPIELGDHIGGRFSVLQKLGYGSFGTV